MQISGDKGSDTPGRLGTGLGDDYLAIAGEKIGLDSIGRHHEAIGKKRRFPAAGRSDHDHHLMLPHGVEQGSDIIIGNAEIDQAVGFAEFAFDHDLMVRSLGMKNLAQTAGDEFAVRLSWSGRPERDLGNADGLAFPGMNPAAGRAAFGPG